MKDIKYILIFSLAFPAISHAEPDAERILKTVFNACRKDPRIEVCQMVNRQMENAKDTVNNKLEDWGIKKATTVAATMAGLITQQDINIRGREVPLLGNDRSELRVGKDQVEFNLTWSLP